MVTDKSKKNLEKRVKFNKENAAKMQALGVEVRNEEKNFVKAMHNWVNDGTLLEKVSVALLDPRMERVLLPIIVKKALPDNVNINADVSHKIASILLDKEVIKAKPIEGVND